MNVEGHLKFFLLNGTFTINEKNLELMGDAFWVSQENYINLIINSHLFILLEINLN